MTRGTGSRVAAGVLALALLATGCTHGDSPPSPAAAVDAFVKAWNGHDWPAMAALVAGPDRGKPARIKSLVRTVARDGDITSFTVTRTAPGTAGPGSAPTPSATFPFKIRYRSDVAARPVSFNGTLSLTLEGSPPAWRVAWTKASLWPGVRGAKGFAVAYKWLARGAILDRHGRKLAVGSGAGRRYPFGATGGSTIGFLGRLTDKDVRQGAIGAPGDYVGSAGLESGLNDRLAGRPTTKLEVVGRRGHVVEVVGREKGHRGSNVKTTLDIEVQRAAEAGYGSTTGGAVVMDPAKGDVLAVVSSSPFDPNNYVGAPGITLFNRALSGLYPPGSSMKVVTSSAALDTGKVTPSTTLTGPLDYKGVHNFHNEHFATLSFADALKFSVNTAFAQVAEKVGSKNLYRYAKAFGFNTVPDIPIGVARSSFPYPKTDSDLMFSAIGQAQTLATPLQMATVAATVADGGKRMDPRLTLSTKPHGTRVMKRTTARTMTTLMEGVVQGGTGVAAQIPGVAVAGKTGTAEVDTSTGRQTHAWFVAFAPAGAPKLAVSVVVELGGVGGEVAAPLARAILERTLPLVH